MPQENDGCRQLDHPEGVVRVTFPSRDDAAEIVQPSKQPLDLPAPTFTTQRPAVLSFRATNWIVRGDEFDVVLGGEMMIEPVAVVRRIADQPLRELVEEAPGARATAS
jgi:hypothetical protein